jgi:hypothetical protein
MNSMLYLKRLNALATFNSLRGWKGLASEFMMLVSYPRMNFARSTK